MATTSKLTGVPHNQTEPPGTSIPLSTLFTSSANSGDSIVGFDVEDETSGGGYLTNNGTIESSGFLYGNTATGIPINQIGQWAFVTGSAGFTDTIGFNVDDASGNNSQTVHATVTASTSYSDLKPVSLSLGSSSVAAGGSLAVYWTMLNQGPGSAPATTTGIRITPHSTGSGGPSDTVADASTQALSSGQSAAQSDTITVPTSDGPGTYDVWVVADNEVSPTGNQGPNNTANDYQLAGSFTVPAPTSYSDLKPVSLSLGSSSVAAGGSLAVYWTMLNQGPGSAPATTTGIRITPHSTGSGGPSDTVADASTQALSSGQSAAQSDTITVPTSDGPGTYDVWVVADNEVSPTGNQGPNNTANDYQLAGSFTVAGGTATVDPFISYTDATPNQPVAADVVGAAEKYEGATWEANNCTGLVWAVSVAIGAPFYETIQTVTNGQATSASQLTSVPDNGYIVPPTAPEAGSSSDWTTFFSSDWTAQVQVGDLVRIPGSVNLGSTDPSSGHSFIVVGNSDSTNPTDPNTWLVIDNTVQNPSGSTVDISSPHTFDNPGNTFDMDVLSANSAYISYLTPSTGTTDTDYPTISLQPDSGSGLGDGAESWDVLALQNWLINQGYLGQGYNTGYYGSLTKSAVSQLQTYLINNGYLAQGLNTGNYGSLTESALQKAYGASTLGTNYSSTTLLPGFDAEIYPGPQIMQTLKAQTNLKWCGYYLDAPSQNTDTGWMGARADLNDTLKLGWYLAPIYVGAQDSGANDTIVNSNPISQADTDAGQALAEMGIPSNALSSMGLSPNGETGINWLYNPGDQNFNQNFAYGTVVFLDWENSLPSQNSINYVTEWCKQVALSGYYKPGIYCPSSDISVFMSAASNLVDNNGNPIQIQFWGADWGPYKGDSSSQTEENVLINSSTSALFSPTDLTYSGTQLAALQYGRGYGIHNSDLSQPDLLSNIDLNLAESSLFVAACYLAGTRIAAERGDVRVEDLVIGNLVQAQGAGLTPIKWIGHRRIDCRRHPKPRNVWPVRVCPDAFGLGMPHRDLFLSPDHAVFIDGVLIPIKYLINGKTVVQEPRDTVRYFHIELAQHDILSAEGLPCESFLDTGNRADFDNGGPVMRMHPEFALRVWEADGCAPLVIYGAELEAARSFLLDRAAQLGHAATHDPDLRLIVAGRELRPETRGRIRRFHLPRAASGIRLVSRSAVPAEVHDDSTDHRQLGVAVSRMIYGGKAIPLTDPRLSSGWHDVEHGSDDVVWRWTDGDAALALPGGKVLDIEVAITERYWLDSDSSEGRKAQPRKTAR